MPFKFRPIHHSNCRQATSMFPDVGFICWTLVGCLPNFIINDWKMYFKIKKSWAKFFIPFGRAKYKYQAVFPPSYSHIFTLSIACWQQLMLKKPLCCIYAQKSTTKSFLLVHSFSNFSFMWLRANCKDGRGLVWQGMKDKDHTIRGAPGLSLISSYFLHFPFMNFLAEKGRWNFPNSPAEGCCGVWVWTVFKNLGQLSFLYFG